MSKVLLDTDLAETYNTEYGKFLLDHLNLIYVAFTRPEIALFISGKTQKRNLNPAKLWLENYFENTTLGKREDGIFKLGNLVKNEVKIKQEINNYPIRFHGEKMDKPVLSYKSAENWDIEDLDEKRLFGTKVHLILSELKHISAPISKELDKVLLKVKRKGIINDSEYKLIHEKISDLFKDVHFAAYFASENQINEKEIINKDGHKLIPDKIIFTAKKTLVVDFKTGQETPKHKQQLIEYIEILREVGYANVMGEIYYTENNTVVTVI